MAKSPTKTTTTRKPRAKAEPQSVEIKRPMSAGAPGDGSIEERIRQRAYELYEEEGRQEGRDEEYWLRAEAEVRGRRSA